MSWETYAQRRRRQFKRRMAIGGMLLFLALLGGHYSCKAPDPRDPALAGLSGEPMVRVKLTRVSGKSSATLSVGSRYEVYALTPGESRGKLLARGTGLDAAQVVARSGSIVIGGSQLPEGWVELVPATDGAIAFGKSSYRGTLLIGVVQGQLLLVNRLLMAKYLAGVLGAEMPLSWDDSALQAQAIAARTYALYELTHQKRSEFFDVYDTTASQVYRGRSIESDKALQAVRRSRGLVLTWQDKPFKAFFHSTCGGQTVDSRQVFPQHDITPLSGRPCTHCSSSGVYRWKQSFSKPALAQKLSKGLGKPIRELRLIEVVSRASGRVLRVRLRHDGKQLTLSAGRLRQIIGYGRRDGLPSTAFEVAVRGGQIVFTGRGWGHGVGMCQFGARGMSDKGSAANDIVRFYYPGADLIKLW